MKYSLLSLFTVVSIFSFVRGATEQRCHMLTAQVLKDRLPGFEHFMEKFKVIESFAGKLL